MKFTHLVLTTIAFAVVGMTLGAIAGTMHDQFVWFVDGAYHALSNPYTWR